MIKASDRVPYERLLVRVKLCGLAGPLYRWLTSYFVDSSQIISINGTLSQPLLITSGVINGSFLGTLLLLAYVDEIFRAVCHGTPFLFADDSKVFYSFGPFTLH